MDDKRLEELRKKYLANVKDASATTTTKSSYKRVLVLDTSGSMYGSKLKVATEVLDKHLKDNDGVVVFNTRAYHVDRKKLKLIMASGETNTLQGLQLACSLKPTSLILITDGETNCSCSPATCIDYVATLTGVVINTIGIGDDVDDAFLRTIAEMTGGKYNHIDQIHELENAIVMLEYKQQVITM